jgi:signal transduction histidine kinase
MSSRLSLRVRLVAGFSVVMLVLLTGAGAFVYWRVQYALDRDLDDELGSATRVIVPLAGPDGRVTSPSSADATGTGWQLLDHGGRVLDSGGPAPGTSLVKESRLDAVGDSGSRTFDVGSFLPVSDQPYRVRVTALSAGGRASYLLVGVRRDHRDEALRELLLQLTLAGVAALLDASVVGDVLARLALRPVERYRRRAAEISAGAAGLRLEVPPDRQDEVTRLGHTLNEMLGALEESLERERQFVDDASHELRTPLTLLKSRIQLTRRRRRTVEEHEAALDELEVDLTRLVELATQLLQLSDRPRREADAHSDVGAVVDAVVRRWRAAHPQHADDVEVVGADHPVHAAVDPQSLDRVVTNLMSNALVHGEPRVTVRVREESGHAVLEVADEGPGMPPDLLTQATRRFSRAAEARARPGSGLGLSIVEQLVVGVGGELRLCHAGHTFATGVPSGVRCSHGEAMTVTVALPGPGR